MFRVIMESMFAAGKSDTVDPKADPISDAFRQSLKESMADAPAVLVEMCMAPPGYPGYRQPKDQIRDALSTISSALCDGIGEKIRDEGDTIKYGDKYPNLWEVCAEVMKSEGLTVNQIMGIASKVEAAFRKALKSPQQTRESLEESAVGAAGSSGTAPALSEQTMEGLPFALATMFRSMVDDEQLLRQVDRWLTKNKAQASRAKQVTRRLERVLKLDLDGTGKGLDEGRSIGGWTRAEFRGKVSGAFVAVAVGDDSQTFKLDPEEAKGLQKGKIIRVKAVPGRYADIAEDTMENLYDDPDAVAWIEATEGAVALSESAVGKTIMAQLGGERRVVAMLGARIAYTPTGVRIAFPSRQRSKGNLVQIDYGEFSRGRDLYDMSFFNASTGKEKLVKKYSDVYADGLVDIFEKQTGWYLRL